MKIALGIRHSCFRYSCMALLVVLTTSVGAEQALVAAATNFAQALAVLKTNFEHATDHRLVVVTGSTGKLYAQIKNGAPFDLFLAADQARPARLEAEGIGMAGSRRTYAVGRLALWCLKPDPSSSCQGPEVLHRSDIRHVAIANPSLAPYGLAAEQTLQHLDLWQRISPRLVRGQNIGEAYAMVATGNAEMGFVALSSILGAREGRSAILQPDSYWRVPETLHDTIAQDAILLRANEAAAEFLDYLGTPKAGNVIAAFGYDIPAANATRNGDARTGEDAAVLAPGHAP